MPAPDWVEQVLAALVASTPPPVLLGGRVLPRWEAPLPPWWPGALRGVLSIVETEGQGEYRGAGLPPRLEPCGANLVVHVATLRAAGGFCAAIGRSGAALLSDRGSPSRLAAARRRVLCKVRFQGGGAPPHSGNPAHPRLAAGAALLAGDLRGSDPAATRPVGPRSARTAASVGGCRAARPDGAAAARQPPAARNAAGASPMRAASCGRRHHREV